MSKRSIVIRMLVFALAVAPCASHAYNPPGVNHLPTVKITKPLNGAHAGINQAIHFKATASHPDDCPGEPNCLAVLWSSQEDGTKKSGSSVTFTFPTPGPRHITASVKDSDGAPASAGIVVYVDPPPTVSILKPQPNQTFYRNFQYVLRGDIVEFDSEATFSGFSICDNANAATKARWTACVTPPCTSLTDNFTNSDQFGGLGGCAPVAIFDKAEQDTLTLTDTGYLGKPKSAAVDINVIDMPPHAQPAVTILKPRDGSSFSVGADSPLSFVSMTNPQTALSYHEWRMRYNKTSSTPVMPKKGIGGEYFTPSDYLKCGESGRLELFFYSATSPEPGWDFVDISVYCPPS